MTDSHDVMAEEPRSRVDPINRDPEEFVRIILDAADFHEPPLRILDCVTHIRNLSLVEDGLAKDGYLIDFGDGFAEILLNANAKRERARYTAAHEIGHWILKVRSPRTGATAVAATRNPELVERWCERFAAALLMPASWVRTFVGSVNGLAEDRVAVEGPYVFLVSRDAFYARLAELYGVRVVRCSREGFDLRVRTWPETYLDELAVQAVLAFLERNYWNRLRGLDSALTTVGLMKLPRVGPSLVVTGGIEPLSSELADSGKW